MFELNEFCRVDHLEQADTLLHQDRKNVILGGLLWMRMGTRKYHIGIDLSGLGLDQITDQGKEIEIGAMTSLRQVEISALLENNFGPVLRQAMAHIVGTQFRTLASVGGSVFSRFGFSDLITALLVLDTKVHTYRGGIIPLANFLDHFPGRDILVKLSIPKQKIDTTYQSLRKSATDFPILAAALSRCNGQWKIAMGARPFRAALAVKAAQLLSQNPTQMDEACTALVAETRFGSDLQGSKAYREHMACTLVKRGVKIICS
ncbi:MAG: FAD binding domain-containing protein [Desulfobacter sp.]|nr:MAG: FAD binding domain-containing protein [Desulfobacter sp.]